MADTLQPCYVIEAALLTSPQPLTLEDLSRLFAGRLTQTELLEAMNMLSEHWKERGLRLVESASGWGFVTSTAVGEYLLRMSDQKMPKYSRAVMETLAIIAYRQPATRGDIEDIRGVAVNPNVLRQLQERGWVLSGDMPPSKEFELVFGDEPSEEKDKTAESAEGVADRPQERAETE